MDRRKDWKSQFAGVKIPGKINMHEASTPGPFGYCHHETVAGVV